MAHLMSFLHNFLIRKIGPPVVGAFVAAWAVLNWEHVVLLLWGSGSLEGRIEAFKLALDQVWYRKYIIPSAIAFLYLVVIPYVSLLLSKLQADAKGKIHQHRTATEKLLLKHDQELNIERVLADPNKPFIEELARQRVDHEKMLLQKQQAETEKLQADAEIAKSEATKQKAEEASNEVKIKRAVAEKLRFEAASQIQKTIIASNRFPAAYSLMSFLDEALKSDGIFFSFEQLTSVVAILFGYQDFEKLIDDPQFNNETINKLLGLYYDVNKLSKQIYTVLGDDEEKLEKFDMSLLLDYFFTHPHIKLIDLSLANDMAQTFVENSKYELFNHDKVAAKMAETNTVFEEVTDIELDEFRFDENGYVGVFSITIDGCDRKGESVGGLPLSINATVRAPLILGQKGLGALRFDEIEAEVIWPL